MSSTPATIHVRDHSKATQSHKLVLYELAGYADDDGIAFPGVLRLAEKTGYKRKWVEKVLDDLVRMGEIRREKVGRSYRYQLYVYQRKTRTCTCVLTDHIPPGDEAYGQSVPEHGQSAPGYGQSAPGYGHTSNGNPTPTQVNPAEPCFNHIEPGLNQCTPVLSGHQEETKTTTCHHSSGCHEPIGILHPSYCQRHALVLAREYATDPSSPYCEIGRTILRQVGELPAG